MYNVVEQNLRAAMRCYSNIGETGEARDYPGVTVASTGLDVPVFNSAMLSRRTETLKPLISTADVHFGSRQLGWTFWLCEDMLSPQLRESGMRAEFRSRHMQCIASPPGMYADRLSQPARRLPEMTFARVCTHDTRLEFAHIASIVFSLAFPTSKRIYGSPGVWQPPSYGWIGYFQNKPVSVVTIVIAAGSVGVYSLGTLPQYQGNGYGETLLRHSIQQAQQDSGLEPSVLQATPQGLLLYQRMGYRIVTKFSIFMREGCASF